MDSSKKLYLGIAAGLGTGLLWGLIFLAPQVMKGYSPMEVTAGRFFFFGLVSLLSAKKAFQILRGLSGKEITQVFALSAGGLWLYTILLFYSVNYNGGVLSAIVIGLLPITISVTSKKTLRLRPQFLVGLVLILSGLIILNVLPAILSAGSFSGFSFIGITCLLSCLALWTWYGVKNSAFLQQRPGISKRDFTSLIGLVSLLCVAGISLFTIDFTSLIHHTDFSKYIVWSAVIGIGTTWLAYWLWNICSAFCPPTISGPLIVSETIFGVLFTFIYQQRFPTVIEASSMALFIFGVFLAIHSEIKNEPIQH